MHMPVKDDHAAHPIASQWREPLRTLVDAIAEHDHARARSIPSVAPLTPQLADRIQKNVAAYGETLTTLPDETWATSVAQWTDDHWDILVDLWTAESGASDLVLHARVFEAHDGFQIVVDSVHVP